MKKSNSIKNTQMRKLAVKVLALAVGSLTTVSFTKADTEVKNIGDLEIYQSATGGQINLMMMLDTSGSMGISSLVLPKNNPYGSPGDVDTTLCTTGTTDVVISNKEANGRKDSYTLRKYDAPATKKTVTVNNETIDYYLRGCYNKNSVGQYLKPDGQVTTNVAEAAIVYDRLSRLKDALITLLAGTSVSNNVKMGLGHFSSKTPFKIGNTSNSFVDSHSGKILVAADKLTPYQRSLLIKALRDFQSVDNFTNGDGTANANRTIISTNQPDEYKASGGTPTAQAYAEAGAAMLGTTTGNVYSYLPSSSTVDFVYDGYAILRSPYSPYKQTYWLCDVQGSEKSNAFGRTGNVVMCDSRWGSTNTTISYTDPTGSPKTIRIGNETSYWNFISDLPAGSKLGGWMKVDNEPMDIEPITGKAYMQPTPSNLGSGIFAYRSSPFSMRTDNAVNTYGGFAYSVANSKEGSNNYKRITSTGTCDGNGIYFLTDGAPNSTNPNIAKTIMNLSLGSKGNFTTTKPAGGLESPRLKSSLFSDETGGWEYIGEYAKRLNTPANNPAGAKIKTAVAGFGSSFEGLTFNTITQKYDCNTAGATPDAKNACKWGQKGEGYGEGGFFYTQSADDIRDSLVAFITLLNNTIPAAPSGTISVPTDPFRTSGSLPYGYLPTVEAQLSGDNNTKLIWPGNLKKYNIKNGTLYGKDDKLLFSTTTATATTESLAGKLNPSTQDLWQTTAYRLNGVEANDAATAGGVYENLKSPSGSSYDTRTVYVEDLPSAGGGNVLRKLSVNTTTGQPSGFDSLVDTTAYSQKNQIKILKFLGFSRGTYTSGGISTVADLDSIPTTVAVKDIVLTKPTAPIKVLGASIHSKPIAVSYGAELDATTGRLKEDTRRDYMLYGSMDGVLHLIKADDAPTGGKENIVIIPRVMMLTQSDAIVPNAKYSIQTDRTQPGYRPAGVPNFGIDAPWILSAQYDYNYTSNKITPNSNAGIYAYGGMRLGGKGLLGFNLSDVNTPKAAFTANPTNDITIPANIAATGTDTSINTSMPTIKGTNLPTGYIVTITLTDSYGIQQTIQTTVDSSGNWSLKPTSSLENGMLYTLKMTKTDPASKTSANPNGSPQTVTTFKINRANLNGSTALIDNNTAEFGRLSYIFNQPAVARMKMSDSDTTGTDVLVFGGGYDKCYENQYFQIGVTADTTNKIASDCAAKTEAEGNAIYIIDAKSGALLWSTTYDASASAGSVTEGKKYMKNSIVAGVTVLDRDNDGFIDHLYAADLGGQVFRVDFKNGNVKTANVNITRILADNQAGTQYARRFYERPNFSVYRDTSGGLFGLVNVISGDRSSPLSTLRATDAHADRVYGILDRDITKSNNTLYPASGATAFTPTVKDLSVDSTGNNIVNLWTAMGTMPSSGYTAAQRTTVINNLANGTKKAWYYPLNRFDGHNNVKYSKGVGVSQVINNTLYTSVYNPDMVYSQVDPCSATIKGGTEREMYCLPYGICTEQYDASTQTGTKTGTGGFLRAGQGIQELSFGPVSASNMTTSVMISTVPISYLVNPNNRVNSGSGGYSVSTGTDIGLNQTGVGGTSDTQGDSSGKISLNTERYVAKPITWFEN